ncbi:L-type lectin-domain containing receptor kinase S.6-like [Lotus japonicus]|uniref:L-type lectin-domain containing receptor kinase S.6-like n=1 Tax=Lotus japonicus TaxID=34305 RepID=UPI00258E394E|nr:L-type lectin-domain containing receptor kinase S.6-like [Lotus japonicus]
MPRGRERKREEETFMVGVGVPWNHKHSGMVTFSLFFILCSFFILLQPSLSSSSTTTLTGFDSDIDLFSDAESVSGTHVRLTRHSPSTSGLLLRRQPLTLTAATSISVEFSFSVSPDAGDGLILLLAPGEFSDSFPGSGSFGIPGSVKSYLGVEFDTTVGIDVGSRASVAVANGSALNLVVNNGEKVNAWVDYKAGSRTLEVRLSKWGEPRSEDPIVSHRIDLFNFWNRKPVFVGLSSSNDANSVQVVSVYSWKVSVREVSKSLHSQPADPRRFSEERKFRTLTVLAGVIFGTVCVALVTFVVLFMWVIFFHKHEEESLAKLPNHPADVRYERIDVSVEKHTKDDEN